MLTQQTYAKINLSLRITGKRDDGYHLLHSIVGFCDVGDTVSVALANNGALTISGPFAHQLSNAPDNIILRAARLLRPYQTNEKGAQLHLEKNLPVASGIGGGSGDAATTLQLLNQWWQCGLNDVELATLGLQLGADVPICLYGKAALMQHIGEALTPITLPESLYILLINPLISVSTKDIFAHIVPPYTSEEQCVTKTSCTTEELQSMRNDLQPIAMKYCDKIQPIIAFIATTSGALCARMSGSGATCFGLYHSADDAAAAAKAACHAFPDYWIAHGNLR